MAISAGDDLTSIRRFFLEPSSSKQRQYEALRAFYIDEEPSAEVAARFGYRPGSFRMLCNQFRHDSRREFFQASHPGPVAGARNNPARDRVIALRKLNHSIYEISELLRAEKIQLSPSAVREILRLEGFAALPRRLDEERPERPRPTVEPVADVRTFSLQARSFQTPCGGLFLFVPDLVRLQVAHLTDVARLPGSKMIPAEHALRSMLALKLWTVEHRSHVMSRVADQGLALFTGLNAIPKKSFLSEFSHRVEHQRTMRFLSAWHDALAGEKLFTGESINLDFHSVPYYGEDPQVERHYVAMRSRRQPSVLAFLAQDQDSRSFCYSNADLRKGEESEEVFRFLDFWKRQHGRYPAEIVFDSKLTTQKGLARLAGLSVDFITLRARTRTLLREIANLPRSAWRKIELDNVTRKYRFPRVYEQDVSIASCALRQLFIQDLGHDEPTILLTNERKASHKALVTRYAHRMLIENALSDSVRFFHTNALSSSVGLKVDFDMALMVLASGLYRLLSRRMRGYADAQARHIFRDLIDTPATVKLSPDHVHVRFHRRAHTPILMASGLLDAPVHVPWWGGATLTMTT